MYSFWNLMPEYVQALRAWRFMQPSKLSALVPALPVVASG